MNAPLTDRDYAQIRHAVMMRVRRRSPFAVRRAVSAFAFAGMVVVIVFLALPKRHMVQSSSPTAHVRSAGGPPAVSPVAGPAAVRPPRAAARVVAGVPRKRHHLQQHRQHPQQVAAVRIDIQTADPDVRIIWFAR